MAQLSKRWAPHSGFWRAYNNYDPRCNFIRKVISQSRFLQLSIDSIAFSEDNLDLSLHYNYPFFILPLLPDYISRHFKISQGKFNVHAELSS